MIQWGRRQLERAARWVRTHPVQILGAFVVLLTLATGVQSLRAERANQRTQEAIQRAQAGIQRAQAEIQRVLDCLKDYSNGVADAIEARGAATQRANDAELDLLQAIFSIAPTPEGQAQARKIFSDYLTAQEQARRDRQAHPFPEPPRDGCR